MGENLQGFGLIEEVPEAGNTFWSVLKGEIRGVDSEWWGAGLEYGRLGFASLDGVGDGGGGGCFFFETC